MIVPGTEVISLRCGENPRRCAGGVFNGHRWGFEY
jgi:hypothetical protein